MVYVYIIYKFNTRTSAQDQMLHPLVYKINPKFNCFIGLMNIFDEIETENTESISDRLCKVNK